MSPKLEHDLEMLSFRLQMGQFDPAKHLKDREKQYVMTCDIGADIFIVRETEDGWWREEHDFKNDREGQIEKLKNDPTVAIGWFGSNRFRSKNGGWS